MCAAVEPAAKRPRPESWSQRHRTYAENWNKADIQLVASNYAPSDVPLVVFNGKEVAKTFKEVYDFFLRFRRDTNGGRLTFEEENIDGTFQSADGFAMSTRFTLGGGTGISKKTWKNLKGGWLIVCDDITYVYVESIPSIPSSVVDRNMRVFQTSWNANNFDALSNLYTSDAILIINGELRARTPAEIGKLLANNRNNRGFTNLSIGPVKLEHNTTYDVVNTDALRMAHRKMTWVREGDDWKILVEYTSPVPRT